MKHSFLVSFLKTKSSTSAKKDDFTQLTLNDIRQLGIPFPTEIQKSKMEFLVQELLAFKKAQPEIEMQKIEMEIDQLVYQLYGLTEEEIKIVEGENG